MIEKIAVHEKESMQESNDFGNRNLEVSTNQHSERTIVNFGRTRQNRRNSYMRKATALKQNHNFLVFLSSHLLHEQLFFKITYFVKQINFFMISDNNY